MSLDETDRALMRRAIALAARGASPTGGVREGLVAAGPAMGAIAGPGNIAGVSPNYIKRAMDVIRHNLKVYVSQSGEMMNVIDCMSGY